MSRRPALSPCIWKGIAWGLLIEALAVAVVFTVLFGLALCAG